jgi:hypothetical protein
MRKAMRRSIPLPGPSKYHFLTCQKTNKKWYFGPVGEGYSKEGPKKESKHDKVRGESSSIFSLLRSEVVW